MDSRQPQGPPPQMDMNFSVNGPNMNSTLVSPSLPLEEPTTKGKADKVKGRREEEKKKKEEKKKQEKDKKKKTSTTMQPQLSGSLQMPPVEMSMAPMDNLDQGAAPSEPVPPPMKRSSSLTNIWSALRRSFGRGKSAKTPDTSSSSSPSKDKDTREMRTTDDLQGNVRPPSGSLGASYQPDLNATGASMHSVAGGGLSGTLGRTTAHPIKVHVVLLDGDDVAFDFDKKADGRVLFDTVCASLDLAETDFFGLTYVHDPLKTWFWLDLTKPVALQLHHTSEENWTFRFQVKFYPPEPSLMREEVTRYQLCIQLRQDIYYGKLPCSWVTLALLGMLCARTNFC
jgi:hypothetical protein